MKSARFILFLSSFLFISCASPPEEKLQQAEQAVEESREVDADTYAPDSYQQAAQALEDARNQISEQEDRFAFLRDYSQVEQNLETAIQTADQAVTEAQSQKEEIRQEAEAARSEAEAALEEARSALESAPRGGKGSSLDRQALTSDLGRAELRYDRAISFLQEGELQQALEGFQSVQRQAAELQAQIP